MQGPCVAISWNARMDFDPRATAVICAVYNSDIQYLTVQFEKDLRERERAYVC